jgi:hypothetical protein
MEQLCLVRDLPPEPAHPIGRIGGRPTFGRRAREASHSVDSSQEPPQSRGIQPRDLSNRALFKLATASTTVAMRTPDST